jgi:non-ribosomal peptide synthetase component F
VKPVDLELETARLDLTVWMVDEPEGLTGVWSYAKDLFDRSTMQTMSTAFESLLSSIVRNPAGRLSALETLTESEKELKALEELDWEETSARQIVGFRRRPVSLDHAG